MNTKNFLLVVVLILILGSGAYWYTSSDNSLIPQPRTPKEETPNASSTLEGKLKAATFSGTLEEVNTACFADGECYVVVDGKHITVVMGWSQETVGSVIGVESFGDLEQHIGETVEVYAQDKSDGTYTLYGSSGFYVKLK